MVDYVRNGFDGFERLVVKVRGFPIGHKNGRSWELLLIKCIRLALTGVDILTKEFRLPEGIILEI